MKNIIFITNPSNNYSIKSWEYWCKKNNCELIIYDKPSIEDTSKFRITVQRWFDVFNLLCFFLV